MRMIIKKAKKDNKKGKVNSKIKNQKKDKKTRDFSSKNTKAHCYL